MSGILTVMSGESWDSDWHEMDSDSNMNEVCWDSDRQN